MKYIISIIVIVLLFLFLIIILKNNKITKKIKNTILIISTTVVTAFLFVFLGSNMITYSSPTVSMLFCNLGETIKTQVDVDGGAFLICQTYGDSGTTVRSILKRGDRWSSIDTNNGQGGFVRFVDDKKGLAGIDASPEKIIRLGAASVIYNYELKKSIISASFVVECKDQDSSSLSVEDLNGNQFIITDKDDTLISNGVTTYNGYMVIDGEIGNSYFILIDGVQEEIYCGGVFP